MLRVLTNGFEFNRFLSYEIDSSLDALADGFSFAIGNPRGSHGGQIIEGLEARIFDDGVQLMVGEIDTVAEGEEIHVSGRDLMVRAIENDVEHREEAEDVHPVKEIERLAREVGLEKIDKTGLPSLIKPIEEFTQEAGESVAEVMVRLADAGGFYIWLDRLAFLHLSVYRWDLPPGWEFFNRESGSNCETITRRRSAANLRTELWAFVDLFENPIVKHADQALIRAGLHRRKTLLDPKSENYEEAHRKLQKLMDELKLRSREWELSYGGPHARGGEIPEVGRTALVSSYWSGVENLKTLVASVRLKKDDQGTKTELVLRERP
jgi:prophage tail gpP-like protein